MTAKPDTHSESSQPLRYAWVSIARTTSNYGNFFIESSLRPLLNLPDPEIVIDAYQPLRRELIDRVNETCRFVVNPGCTTLQPGENSAFDSFDEIVIPKLCFGGCLWQFGRQSRIKLASKALGTSRYGMRAGKRGDPDPTIAGKMSQPVGSRDPFTHACLEEAGIESVLTGCPTLLSPNSTYRWHEIQGRRLTVSFCRYALPAQIRVIRHLARSWDITVLIHEHYESYAVAFLGGVRKVVFRSAEQFFDHYRNCDAVLTGRLHGALPAIRFGRPIVFFGNAEDTRFSLLRYLGLPIRPLSMELKHFERFPEITSPDPKIFQKVLALAENFVSYCRVHGIECNWKR